ncbi:hypothetical protein GUJ93_ZPchr0011g27090, partial [Zizania palustris]
CFLSSSTGFALLLQQLPCIPLNPFLLSHSSRPELTPRGRTVHYRPLPQRAPPPTSAAVLRPRVLRSLFCPARSAAALCPRALRRRPPPAQDQRIACRGSN